MCLRESPSSLGLGPIFILHLVARMKSSRRPASHRPIISSVLPTASKETGTGYTSAVSMKLTPPAAASSITRKEVCSSHWWPKSLSTGPLIAVGQLILLNASDAGYNFQSLINLSRAIYRGGTESPVL